MEEVEDGEEVVDVEDPEGAGPASESRFAR
jgi:hypothetical protein